METIARRDRAKKIKRRFCFQNFFCVEARGTTGGLALYWSDYYEIQIIEASLNFIHTAIIVRRSGSMFDCTFVYGNPTFVNRRNLWGKRLRFKPWHQEPWCCLGDFNELKESTENVGLRPKIIREWFYLDIFLMILGLWTWNLKGVNSNQMN